MGEERYERQGAGGARRAEGGVMPRARRAEGGGVPVGCGALREAWCWLGEARYSSTPRRASAVSRMRRAASAVTEPGGAA